jgi:hypothetical protein
LEAEVRSGLVAIGVLTLALASCATIPTPHEANDAVLMLRQHGSWVWATAARSFAQRLAGPRSLQRLESSFDRSGAWAIILTRSLPFSVPEAMVFLAGLAGMPMRKFTAALTIGSVPTPLALRPSAPAGRTSRSWP